MTNEEAKRRLKPIRQMMRCIVLDDHGYPMLEDTFESADSSVQILQDDGELRYDVKVQDLREAAMWLVMLAAEIEMRVVR